MSKESKEIKMSSTAAAGIMISALVIGPLIALAVAWTCSIAWRWFMAAQYGDGPTMSSWFGIGLLVTLLRYESVKYNPDRDAQIQKSWAGYIATEIFTQVIHTLILMAGAAVVGRFAGWK